MAEKKISELPIIETPSGSAIIPIVVDSTNSYSTANTNAISASALAFYIGQQLNAARTNTTNTFSGTQNFDGAVFLNGDVNIVGNVIGGIRGEISGLEAFTSSLRNEVNNIEEYTASLKAATLISGSAQISALGFSAAANGTVSSSAQITELSYIHSTTGSLNLFTGSTQVSVNSLNTKTSSFALTGSENIFYANQTITGSLGVNDIFLNSSSIYLNSNEVLYRSSEGGNPYVYLHSYDSDGLSLNVNNKSWKITTDGTITTSDSSDIENSNGLKVFNSLSKIHTYTGSIEREEISGIEAYTASLKGQAIVSSSTQISNYYKFAETASANTFYGTQTISGSFNVSGSTIQTGNNTLIGNIILSGSIFISGSRLFTGETVTIGNTILSGSIAMSGSTVQSGDNTLTGNNTITGSNLILGDTVMSGSIDVSGSSNFHNSRFVVTGSSFFTGSHFVDGNSVFSGSINIASGSSYYRAGNKLFNYGQWGSVQTQSGSINTASPIKLDTKFDGSEGVSIVNNGSGFPTRITAENTGLYNIQFSLQLNTTATETCDFSVWFAMTGSNIENSNTDFSIDKTAGGGNGVAALNLLTPINAGDYVELYWSNTTGNGQLQYKAVQSTPTRPATPSVIVTVTQVA